MERVIRCALALLLMLTLVGGDGAAQQPLSSDDVADVHLAVGSAFEFLYELPRDTAGAALGAWVLDSNATTVPTDSRDLWRIVVTRLTDTGEALNVEEMTGRAASSAAELAAAMQEVQQLEAKISKAEAEASLEVQIALNGAGLNAQRELQAPVGERAADVVPLATSSWRARGHWTTVEDRDLGITVERWVPGALYVRFDAATTQGISSITINARGSEVMLDRLVAEARWVALAKLVN